MLTREDIDKAGWLGDQREQVLELLDRAERGERAEKLMLDVVRHFGDVSLALTQSQRCEIAVRLLDGTSMKVTVR